MVELCRDLVTKQPTCASWTDGPRLDILWVTPYQVTEGTLMRNLLRSCHNPDLIDSPNLRAETTVDTENCAVHNGG